MNAFLVATTSAMLNLPLGLTPVTNFIPCILTGPKVRFRFRN